MASASGDNLIYAVRSSVGFGLRQGLEGNVLFDDTSNPKDNPCQAIKFSNNGRLFAYCDGQRTRVLETRTLRPVLELELKRTTQIVFSPLDTHIVTYQPYQIYGPKTSADQKPDPNMRIFCLETGECLSTLIAQKKDTWEPQWTADESIVARMTGGEIFFYHGANFSDTYTLKYTLKGMGNFALSPSTSGLPHVAIYLPESGSEPGRVQVLSLEENFPIVCGKSMFKFDKATLTWNHRGSALLVMASVDVDKSNQSYYGEQQLYLMNVVTGDASMVPLGKKGPVYAARWNPNGKEFAVCYGYMPAKLTFYNTKGEPTFDTAEGPRNDLHYNAFGNILLVCGFGNLARGKMEFWDVAKKKEIVSIDVPNTTQFEWAPDGEHFFTATTAPRLRIDNCYRLWHYSGKMLYEKMFDSPREELWQVIFCPDPSYNKFEIRELTKFDKFQSGLPIKKKDASHPLNNVPAGAVRQQSAYIPPHLRGKSAAERAALTNAPVAVGVKPQQMLNEKDKKIRQVEQKLADINKLKEKQNKGEVLQKNQLEKMNKEQELSEELEKLKLLP